MMVPLLAIIFLSISSTVADHFIAHVTDIHFDRYYSAKGDPKELCHQNYENKDGTSKCSKYGNYLADSPEILVKSALENIAAQKDDFDFVLWTGDDPSHSRAIQKDDVINAIEETADWMHQAFPTTRVFPCPGNHDMYPAHQLPPNPSWIYNITGAIWEKYFDLDHEQFKTFYHSGYYSHSVNEKLDVICINTVLYYQGDEQAINLEDPGDQFKWLNFQLNKARLNNKKVYLFAHVPPAYGELGFNESNFHFQFNIPYFKHLEPHSDVIIAHFLGHEHRDSVRIFPDQSTGLYPKGVAFLAPSITPWYNNWSNANPPNNPGVRYYQVDDDYKVIDVFQLWVNLSESIKTESYNWQLEYQFSKLFNTQRAPLTPEMLHKIASRMWDDQNLLDKYYYFNPVSYGDEDGISCLGTKANTCRKNYLCATFYATHPKLYFECQNSDR